MLPETVRSLLREHLTSFEALEILLFLYGRAGEPSSLDELSSSTGVPIALTRTAVAVLESSQLVQRSAIEPLTFRFAPITAALREAVADLARLYHEQRTLVMSEMSINAIARVRSASLRAFADAFVLGTKKRDSDG